MKAKSTVADADMSKAGRALERAVVRARRLAEQTGTPLYVFHEIVHNTAVVESFRTRGVIFVNDIADVPNAERVIFSAHGVAPEVLAAAKAKNLKAIDATIGLRVDQEDESAGLDLSQHGERAYNE